jgi:septum formation protein
MKKLILASGSPRRALLLSSMSLQFVQKKAEIDETPKQDEKPENYVLRIAKEKALKVAEDENGIILGADTIVVVDSTILQKPSSREDAFQMLSRLQGRDHFVYTGIYILNKFNGKEASGYTKSRVWFSPLTPEEIWRYIDSGEPMDKAGAYGIQAMGAFFIEKIDGDFFSVMGLPLNLLWKLSKEVDFELFR